METLKLYKIVSNSWYKLANITVSNGNFVNGGIPILNELINNKTRQLIITAKGTSNIQTKKTHHEFRPKFYISRSPKQS